MATSEDEDPFDFGGEGNAALDTIDASLHDEGWATHYTTRRGLRTWFAVAEKRWADSDTVDDYTNDVCARDALELALGRSHGALHDRLAALIARADQEFLASTKPDTDRLLEGFLRIDAEDGWWWRRIPSDGAVIEELRASR
ncbi:hypothetical protein [Agromyces sp. NPDC058064]|uniref:hypothetical protein n=1 Tax=Agromyces sp. NPDC058064 TaxID=3346322 RepID=UPI0036D7BCA1